MAVYREPGQRVAISETLGVWPITSCRCEALAGGGEELRWLEWEILFFALSSLSPHRVISEAYTAIGREPLSGTDSRTGDTIEVALFR